MPQVPPTELKPAELDFYHVGDSMQIFDDKNPVAIPTERGGPFPPVYKITNLREFIKTVQDSKDHRKDNVPFARMLGWHCVNSAKLLLRCGLYMPSSILKLWSS